MYTNVDGNHSSKTAKIINTIYLCSTLTIGNVHISNIALIFWLFFMSGYSTLV